jgi:putative ABC transport system permease protein
MSERGLVPGRLAPLDLARVATVGLRTRRLRAALSALGIAIGVAAIVAVLGLSSSSQAGLLAEIDRLGTNLLTVTNGSTLAGGTAKLPLAAPGMIARIGPVTNVERTGATDAKVYRSPHIPAINTNGLGVQAASLGLLHTIGATLATGRYLNAATARLPIAVLGAAAAKRLGIDRVHHGERIWLGGQWFYLAGISAPPRSPPRSTAPCWPASAPPSATWASTATQPRSTCAPRRARSPPSKTCSPPPPTRRHPTRST